MKHFDAVVEAQVIKAVCDSERRMWIMSQINDEFFGSDEAKEIYHRISTLVSNGKPVPSTELLRSDTALTEPSKAFLSNQGVGNLRSDDDMEIAIGMLGKYRKARLLLQMITEGVDVLRQDDPDLDSVVSSMEMTLQKCHTGNTRSEMKHYKASSSDELSAEVMNDLMSMDEDGIHTGFTEFDRKTGGFRRKNVIAMGSEPGGGKSAMALQIAINQYLMGYDVCYISYEMDEIEMRYRLLANVSKIDHSDIHLKKLNPQKLEIINSRFKEFIESRPNNRLTFWCPERELNIPEITAEIKPLCYDVVYIDYIQLLKQNPKKQLWEDLGDHARAAKLSANVLNCALVLLCQFDAKENKIKYSRAIQANASFVWVWENGDREKELGIIEIKQLKARNAPVYPFYLQRDFSKMTFSQYNGPPPPRKEDFDKPKEPGKREIPRMPELRA